MGLFDFFSKNREERPRSTRDLARLERLMGSKLSQNYDRQEAIDELTKMADASSAAVLLKRFDWHLDPSITDQEEKEACARGISAAGEDAIEPIRRYCKKAESVAWPLKILAEIVPADRMGQEVLSLLDQFDTEYVRNPEPKVQLLQALERYPSEEVRVAVEPFLGDASETVRFTAANTVFAVGDPASVPAFIAALAAEESLRTKNRIAQGLVDRGWSVPSELHDSAKKSLPPGYALRGDLIAKG